MLQEVFHRSSGLFLYIRLVSQHLKSMDRITLADIRNLPADLNSTFETICTKLIKPEALGAERYRCLVDLIGTAREPLHRTALQSLLGSHGVPMESHELDRLLKQCRDLVDMTGDGKVRFLHKRVYDWLTTDAVKSERSEIRALGVDSEHGHYLLAAFCSTHRGDPYSMDHGVYHLTEDGRVEDAKGWMRDVEWLVRRIASSKAGRVLACASCAADARQVQDKLMANILELSAPAGERPHGPILI